MEVVVKFMQAKKEHTDYTKKELCALIGVSDSYLKRVMKDLDIKSFYRHDVPVNTRRGPDSSSLYSRSVSKKKVDDGASATDQRPDDAVAKKQPKIKGGEISDEYIDKLIRIKELES